MVQQGEAVNPGQELFKVVRSDVLELSGQVPVDAAAQIRVGQPVVFTLSAQPGTELSGEVARIEPMANTETRQVGVYLRLRNPGGIIGGQFATGRVIGQNKQEAIVLPEVAIRGNGADRYVFVVKEGRVSRRAVTLGVSDPSTGNVAIASGVDAGEQVIVTPASTLQDGSRVQLGAPAAAPAEAEKESH
jgi:RND family efflux transporter MFP subunit